MPVVDARGRLLGIVAEADLAAKLPLHHSLAARRRATTAIPIALSCIGGVRVS
jgi:CBS-domain-containing membrane protein